MNEPQNDRPVTSKARGLCRYYNTPRGCFAGDRCKFLHIPTSDADKDDLVKSGKPILTPYDRAKRCRYYSHGFCKHGEKCWFLHIDSQRKDKQDDDEEICCSICFEKPATFGLLDGCSHIFCLKCIRQWRDPSGKTIDVSEAGRTKKCPMCRADSRYIIPSSHFWKDGEEGKAQAMQNYKNSMSRVSCKYFQESKQKNARKPLCPFGKDCFYRHSNDDGTPHLLKDGKDKAMRTYRNLVHHRRTMPFTFGTIASSDSFHIAFNVRPARGAENTANLAGNIAMGMFDRMVAEVMSGMTGSGRGQARSGGGQRPSSMDQATIDRARRRMAAGPVPTIQTELAWLDPGNTGRNGPVVVPGTLVPTEWDWSDNIGGEGWDLEPTGVPDDADVLRRLGVLDDHMLGAFPVAESGDRPAGEETPPPPLEPINDDESGQEDSIPELQSVSDSSDEESEASEDASIQGVQVAPETVTWELPSEGEEESHSWPLFPTMWLQNHQSLPPVPSPSDQARSRFSTVVGREESSMTYVDVYTGDDAVENEADDEREEDRTSEASITATVAETITQSPFVTDGRGRVVWSNKAPENRAGEGSAVLTTNSTDPPTEDVVTTEPRTLLGRVLGAFFE